LLYLCGFADGSIHKIPLRKGGKGVVKIQGEKQPPKSPFVKGNLAGLT